MLVFGCGCKWEMEVESKLKSNDTVITRYTGIRHSFKENQTARLKPFASIRAEQRFLIVSMKFDLRIDIYYSFFSDKGRLRESLEKESSGKEKFLVFGSGIVDCLSAIIYLFLTAK